MKLPDPSGGTEGVCSDNVAKNDIIGKRVCPPAWWGKGSRRIERVILDPLLPGFRVSFYYRYYCCYHYYYYSVAFNGLTIL